jgi:P4 family phage/plasmid primase-like protien
LTQTSPLRQPQSNIAFPWWDAGCSVVPIRTDGSKRPTMPWAPLQRERLTEQDVIALWGDDSPLGVAVICGAISGSLEMLELEAGWTSSETLFLIEQHMDEQTASVWHELMELGYVEWTPSGGLHLLYALADAPVTGNVKIAQGPDLKTRSETRGEGGYVIVAPTPGACHPSGEGWVQINGGPETIRTITLADRDAIHAAIKVALDETPPPPPPPAPRVLQLRPQGAISVGDDFAMRTDWADMLVPLGWTLESEGRGGERLWARPGKNPRDGASASTDYMGKPGLFVWSTSAGLPTEEPLSKLFVYAHYHTGGDMRLAVKELAKLKYGTPLEPRPGSDTFMGTPAPSTEIALQGDKEVDSAPTEPEQPYKVSHMDDSGMAEFFFEHLPYRVAYVAERKKWFFYENGAWQIDPDGIKIKTACRVVARMISLDADRASADRKYRTWAHNAANDGRINAAVNLLKTYAHVPLASFDQDRNLLNVTNGTIDLTSMELLPHEPDQHLTKKMDAAFNPKAKADRWHKYLDEVLPDAATQDFLQRMVGYSLLGYPAERALAVLHGPGGTGKSRFIEMLSSVMGTYAATAGDSLFRTKGDGRGGPTNDLNDLRGARLAAASELDSGVRMDESLVKRLTGLDRITSRGLYEENTTWTPQCVIWLATNHHFKIQGDDGAIWERIKVIPFTQKIQNRDPYILDELLKERDGILNWMLEGLLKYKDRGLADPPAVVQAVEAAKVEQNTAIEFINEMLMEETLLSDVDNQTYQIKPVLVKNLYLKWCREQSYRPLGAQRLYQRLETMGYKRMRPSGKSQDHFIGLSIGHNGFMGSI